MSVIGPALLKLTWWWQWCRVLQSVFTLLDSPSGGHWFKSHRCAAKYGPGKATHTSSSHQGNRRSGTALAMPWWFIPSTGSKKLWQRNELPQLYDPMYCGILTSNTYGHFFWTTCNDWQIISHSATQLYIFSARKKWPHIYRKQPLS